MMSSSPSELSFLSNDIGLESYPTFSHDTEFGDMMSSYMKMNDFTINPMMTQTLPISMMNGAPLSPESDNGSFTDSVISSNSSQSQQQQQHSSRSDNDYHTHMEEPLSPLPDDYFINMANLQAQQQPTQQQQQPQPQEPHQPNKPMILHTTPPTTPTEVKTPITPTSTSSVESKPAKKQRKSKVKPEPVEEPVEDDMDMVIDPNLPPDVIRELLQEQNLKKKRLARKAELARMSRKRKKTRMGDLEQECERLHAEIDRLRKMRRLDMDDNPKQQQQAVKPAVPSNMTMIQEEDGKFVFDSRRWIDVSDHQKLVNDSIQAMADAARTTQGQEDTTYMGKLHETFVTHFNRQLVASEGHIAALENHLSPCMPLQFLQWVMSQPDKFIQDSSGLWNSLFQAEIGVTVDQMKEIMALRTTVKKQRKVTVDVEKAYKKLSHSLRRQMLQSNENLTKLRSILSPLQLAKYFDWVNRFGHVCVKINL